MKTSPLFFVALFALLFGSFFGSSVQAAASRSVLPSGASECRIEFRAEGRDIQILVGYSRLKGTGRIVCVSGSHASPQTTEAKIKVTIGTPVLFPRIAFAPSLVVHGRAEGVRILKGGPSVLFGDYLTLDFRAAGGAGIGAMLTLEGQDNGISIQLSLENVEGFGIAAGGTRVTFEAL